MVTVMVKASGGKVTAWAWGNRRAVCSEIAARRSESAAAHSAVRHCRAAAEVCSAAAAAEMCSAATAHMAAAAAKAAAMRSRKGGRCHRGRAQYRSSRNRDHRFAHDLILPVHKSCPRDR
jgi:hypothetical protein